MDKPNAGGLFYTYSCMACYNNAMEVQYTPNKLDGGPQID